MTDYTHWLIRARLKTRQLLLIVALADEGNIHRAAQVLNMTQPAASKLLKDMEDVLGVQLFDRLPRGMRPTWYGETMIRHARAALNSLNQANDEVQAAKLGQFGQVNLGAITAPGVVLLPSTIATIKRANPNLRITIQIESSNVLVEQLSRGSLDLVVGRLSEEHHTADLRYETIADELVCAVARPGHPLFNASQLTLTDLLDFCWIVPPVGSVMRHQLDLMFQELDLPQLKNRLETGSLLFMTKMMQESDMVGMLAVDAARYYADHGLLRILPVVVRCQMAPFGFITRRDKQLPPAAQVVLNALKTTALTVYGKQFQPGKL